MDDIFSKIVFFLIGVAIALCIQYLIPTEPEVKFIGIPQHNVAINDTFKITSNKADVYLDTVQFCDAPWWPTFTDMVPDVYNPGFCITKIDSLSDGGYRVHYTIGTTWGEYYLPGCNRSR